MKTFKVYGNFAQLLATIEAEDYNEAYDQIDGVYTTPVELVEA
jgi:hypothetical protein